VRVEGAGIGLPPGVGEKPQDDERDARADKPQPARAAACAGRERDGQQCIDGAGTDPVVRRIEQGLERDPGSTKPMDVKVFGSGASSPARED
jgi:hypothetical protein